MYVRSSCNHLIGVHEIIDIIHGTGLETHPINTFLMASPCYSGRSHVTHALFGIMAGVAMNRATTASSELLRTAVQMVLEDDGFNIPSEPARKAGTLAENTCSGAKKKRTSVNSSYFLKTW